MIQVLQEPSWVKIKKLIEERFNRSIEYRYLGLVQPETSVAQDANSTKYFFRGDDLVLNLQSNGAKLGQVLVTRGAHLSTEDRIDILDMIDFLVRPLVYEKYLRFVEDSLRHEKRQIDHAALEQITTSDTNVIVIDDYFKNSDTTDLEFLNNEANSLNKTGIEQIISRLLHLRSSFAISRKKVAVKIHEMLGHAFFLDYQQIATSVQSLNDLKDLGGATIYIEDLQNIELKDLNLLTEFIAQQDELDVVFLVGSSMTDERIHKLNCKSELKNDLIGFSFDIDRIPVQMQSNDEVLQIMFFDHLSYSN